MAATIFSANFLNITYLYSIVSSLQDIMMSNNSTTLKLEQIVNALFLQYSESSNNQVLLMNPWSLLLIQLRSLFLVHIPNFISTADSTSLFIALFFSYLGLRIVIASTKYLVKWVYWALKWSALIALILGGIWGYLVLTTNFNGLGTNSGGGTSSTNARAL